MIIPPPPSAIEETAIYQKLVGSDPKNGLVNLATTFIHIATPIADSIIAGPFERYTLHNRDHIKKLLHLAQYVISEETLTHITGAEALLFLYAAFLHDIGMATTAEERERLLSSEAYHDSIAKWTELSEAFSRARKKTAQISDAERAIGEVELADLYQAALANYLRPLHATAGRYRSFIHLFKETSGRADLFQINGQSFENELVAICESHNLPTTVLGEMVNAYEDRFPRATPIGGFVVNLQFLAAVLRIVDILDFDYERTPRSLFESLGIRHSHLPGSEVTLLEWQKHLAIQTIEISREEIIITGTSNHPVIEAAIREFCAQIQREIQETQAILRRNPGDIFNRYQLALPAIVRPNIRSEGYIYMDLALRLDEAAVMTLLMGQQLYESPLIAVRELIQNSVDAALVRGALVPDPTYDPRISVSVDADAHERLWLTIQDNGIGMDDFILKHHFFRVGSSYYTSHDFLQVIRTANVGTIPINSKFGIGFLSTFMLGQEIVISTRKVYPGGGLSPGYRITIEKMGALAFVQEDDSLVPGTTVKVRLRENDLEAVRETFQQYIESNVVRPACPVDTLLKRSSSSITSNNFYSLKLDPRTEIHRYNVELVETLIEEPDIRGKVFLIFWRLENASLSWESKCQFIDITEGSARPKSIKVNPRFLISGFEGNRITIGGFRISLPNLGRLLRRGSRSVAAIYDVDFTPGPDVRFNVARTKILDQQMKLRNQLRTAIFSSLQRDGVVARLDEATRKLIELNVGADGLNAPLPVLLQRAEKISKERGFTVTADLLESVARLLPVGRWPDGFYRDLAVKLGISPAHTYAAVCTLLGQGVVELPPDRRIESS